MTTSRFVVLLSLSYDKNLSQTPVLTVQNRGGKDKGLSFGQQGNGKCIVLSVLKSSLMFDRCHLITVPVLVPVLHHLQPFLHSLYLLLLLLERVKTDRHVIYCTREKKKVGIIWGFLVRKEKSLYLLFKRTGYWQLFLAGVDTHKTY